MFALLASAFLLQSGQSPMDPNINQVLAEVQRIVRDNNAAVPGFDKFCLESRVCALRYDSVPGAAGRRISMRQGPTMAAGEVHVYTSFNFADREAPRMEQRYCIATGVGRNEEVVQRIVGDGQNLIILDLKAGTREVLEYSQAERPAESMIRGYLAATPPATILAKRFVAGAYLKQAWMPIMTQSQRIDILAPSLGHGFGSVDSPMVNLTIKMPASPNRGWIPAEQIDLRGDGGLLHVAYLTNLDEGHTLVTMPNMESPNASYNE